jgi:hypothetical protein
MRVSGSGIVRPGGNLANRLVGAWVPLPGLGGATAIDGVGRSGGTPVNAPGRSTLPGGRPAWSFASASSQYFDCGVIPAMAGVSKATIFASGFRASGNRWFVGIGSRNSYRFNIMLWEDNNSYSACEDGGICYVFHAAPTGYFTAALVYDYSASDQLVQYINGVKASTGLAGGVIPASLSAVDKFEIGAETGNARYAQGLVEQAYLWAGRAMTPSDVWELHLRTLRRRPARVGRVSRSGAAAAASFNPAWARRSQTLGVGVY